MPSLITTEALYALAEEQDGYFSTVQALSRGVSRKTLSEAAKGGSVLRITRGVYRLVNFPEITPNSHLWEAALWPQVRSSVIATISHLTALRLHELSDVNAEQTYITVPSAFRITRTPPSQLIVYRADLEKYEVQYVDGLATTTVERTLRDVAAMGNDVVLHDALRDARARNLSIPPALANT